MQSVSAASVALRTLVSAVVDYAGLFPPAALDMRTAVANFAAYRASSDAWMLGRFVVPVSRLDEWTAAVSELSATAQASWHGARLSALLSGEFALEAECISAFNASERSGVRIDVAEGRASSPDAVLAMAAAMPDDVMLYCELPVGDDPEVALAAVKSAQVRAKLRTGGVTADAFPSPEVIVRFLRRCHEHGITAKVTAGLHHPIRGAYRLTYAPDAPSAEMYGYLNLFLAAAAIREGAPDAVALAVLMLTDASAIVVHDTSIEVAGVTLSAVELESMRRDGVVAFGSCSFREPVDELATAPFS